MDHNEVVELEEACERAIAEVLRKHYVHTTTARAFGSTEMEKVAGILGKK